MAKKKYSPKKKRIQPIQNMELSTEHKDAPSEDEPISLINFDKYQALFLALLIAVGFIIYANTLHSPFIFDDLPAIVRNHTIRMQELSGRNIINGAIGYGRNRPISMLSFAFNYYFGQYNVVGYHLVNIFIHIITGILFFFFLKITLTISNQQRAATPKLGPFAVTSISFLSAFLWLVHPIQTQSVTYIIQRMNSMGAMFFILALLLYAKGRLRQHNAYQGLDTQALNDRGKRHSGKNYFWFIGSGLAGILALGSKESTAFLPFFIFLYEWYFFQDLNKNWLKKQLKFAVAAAILCCVIAGLYLGLEPIEKIKTLKDFAQGQFTMGERLLTQTRVVIYYLSLIAYPNPSRLNLDYNFPLSSSLIDPITTLLSLIVIIGLIFLGAYLAKRERLVSFCIFWFFGNLVIESSVIPLAIIFEHRLYLPSMLVCLLIVNLIYRHIRLKWLSVVIICAFAVLGSFWTFERNKVWRNEFTLYTDGVEKSPNKARSHTNLGVVLLMRNMDDDAIRHFREAIQLNPNYFLSYHNLGFVLAGQGKTDQAIVYYRKALQINPNYPEAYNNLGTVLLEQGKVSEAIENFRKALQINPDLAEAHFHLGDALVDQGKTNEAIEHYLKSLQLQPDLAEAHNNWGFVLERQGKINEAIEHYLKALQINPDLAEAHFNLGDALANQGKTNEAIDHYRKSLQIKPDLAEAHDKLGFLLVKQGNIKEAVEHYHRSIEIKPDIAETHFNLGDAFLKQGNSELAIAQLQKALEINPDYAEAHNNLGG